MGKRIKMLGLIGGVLVLAVLACVIPTSLLELDGEDTHSESEGWQLAVDEIKVLTRNQAIPQHLLDPGQADQTPVFDPNELLVPLTHLSMQPGFVLDFVYWDRGGAASPILYARPEGQAPLENYAVYQQVLPECSAEDPPPECDYMTYVHTDGSEEGFFQWVVLRTMGAQFYLNWHAEYNDAEIVASKDRLEALTEETFLGTALSASQKRQALRIDPAPVVTRGDDLVTVRVVWFTKWGGFYETITTIATDPPHRVIDEETQQLLEYDCGVRF